MVLDVVNTDCKFEFGASPCVSFRLSHWLCSFRDAPRGLETSPDLAQQLIPETIRGGGGGGGRHGRQQFKVRRARRDNVLKCICSHQRLRYDPSFPYFHYLLLKGALCQIYFSLASQQRGPRALHSSTKRSLEAIRLGKRSCGENKWVENPARVSEETAERSQRSREVIFAFLFFVFTSAHYPLCHSIPELRAKFPKHTSRANVGT